jgi:hypothetical protein
MMNLNSELKSKRWIFMILVLGFRFSICSSFFKFFIRIHRSFLIRSLRWWKWEGFAFLPEFAWRFEQVDPRELLILLVSFKTENKSVFDLLLLRTGLILLQFLLFSSLRDRAGICHPWWWIRTELRSKLFDDDDPVEDYWEQCWILRNCDESWLNLNSGISRVSLCSSLFLMNLKTVMILILDEMRENQFGVCDDLARCEWNSVTVAMIRWLYIGCHVYL